jgi:hypothetical protein
MPAKIKDLSIGEILALANGLITVVGKLSEQIAKIKGLAAQAGVPNEQLDELDARLTAALEKRKAEQ